MTGREEGGGLKVIVLALSIALPNVIPDESGAEIRNLLQGTKLTSNKIAKDEQVTYFHYPT